MLEAYLLYRRAVCVVWTRCALRTALNHLRFFDGNKHFEQFAPRHNRSFFFLSSLFRELNRVKKWMKLRLNMKNNTVYSVHTQSVLFELYVSMKWNGVFEIEVRHKNGIRLDWTLNVSIRFVDWMRHTVHDCCRLFNAIKYCMAKSNSSSMNHQRIGQGFENTPDQKKIYM